MSSVQERTTNKNVIINEIKPGIYEHFKGNHYKVYGIALCKNSGEKLVLYRQMYGDYKYWVRPADMFINTINTEHGVIFRFFLTDEPNVDLFWDENYNAKSYRKRNSIFALHSEDQSQYLVSKSRKRSNEFIAQKISR